MSEVNFKSCKRKIEDIDEKGVIRLYANTFNYKDSDGDISAKGSFNRTLKNDGGRIKHFLNHDMFKWESFIGIPIAKTVNDVGLLIDSKLNLEKTKAMEMYKDYIFMAENGLPVEHSIGYEVMQRDEKDKDIITEYKLWEYSSVTYGANDQSISQEIKSQMPSMIKSMEELSNDSSLMDYFGQKLMTDKDFLCKLASNRFFLYQLKDSLNALHDSDSKKKHSDFDIERFVKEINKF